MRLLLVAGARPNFVKVGPLMRECRRVPDRVDVRLVHTGQHYDPEMSSTFFEEFGIPDPDWHLGVGSGSHAVQTARIMTAFEEVLLAWRPDMVVVVGDVNSTLACSVTARKMQVRVAHVEAGLRSFDETMPEEINRLVTDAISDVLLATEQSAVDNLLREGRPRERIHLVGNVMIDTLHYCLARLDGASQCRIDGAYGVVTLHRPSNVDAPDKLSGILDALSVIARDVPLYFPMHPRTRRKVDEFGLSARLEGSGIQVRPPASYMDFLRLWKDAALVLTDSGGVQEETTALGIPCFTIRDNTERPVTIDEGTNVLAGTTRDSILACYEEFRKGNTRQGRVPPLWDGKAAERIVQVLLAQQPVR